MKTLDAEADFSFCRGGNPPALMAADLCPAPSDPIPLVLSDLPEIFPESATMGSPKPIFRIWRELAIPAAVLSLPAEGKGRRRKRTRVAAVATGKRKRPSRSRRRVDGFQTGAEKDKPLENGGSETLVRVLPVVMCPIFQFTRLSAKQEC